MIIFSQQYKRTDRLSNGLTKSLCIEIDKQTYDALTAICKRENKNRAALLRPVIAEFVMEAANADSH
jgi:hypothetical protein